MDDTHAELVLDWYEELELRLSALLNTVPYTVKTQDELKGTGNVLM